MDHVGPHGGALSSAQGAADDDGELANSFTAATWNMLADGLAQGGGWLYVRSCFRSLLLDG